MPSHRNIALIAALLLGGCSQQIQHGLDERQANEIQSVLVERGLDAEKVPVTGKKPTWSIEVPDDQATDAIRILSELGLPRPQAEGISDVFGKGSLVPSPTEERALYLQAISGELARTLESVEGVVSARVHLVLPPAPRPGAAPVPAKASAFLKVRPGRMEGVHRLRDELRALVAGAVENLSPESVTLVVAEISTSVPARTSGEEPFPPIRSMVAGMAGTVTLLSLVVVWLTLRLRRGRPLVKVAPPRKVA
jgi:type III secretion protein J